MNHKDEMRRLINLVEGIFSTDSYSIDKYIPNGLRISDTPAHLKKFSTTQLKELLYAAHGLYKQRGDEYYKKLSDLVWKELSSRGKPLQFSPSAREPDGEPSSYQPPDGGISGEVRTRDRTPREKENLRGAEAQWRIRQLGQNPFRRPN